MDTDMDMARIISNLFISAINLGLKRILKISLIFFRRSIRPH